MNIIYAVTKFGIYAVFGITLLAALLAVCVRNIFHAALSLALTLIGVAAVYFVLRAEFLGAAQILLYVGGIMILIIFTVMLTSNIGSRNVLTSNRQRLPAAAGVFFIFLILLRVAVKTPWSLSENLAAVDAAQIGKALLTTYVFPFEVIGVVLVAILIGAVTIAKSEAAK